VAYYLFIYCRYLETVGASPRHVNTLMDGAVFGEIALVHPEKPRTATVCATTFCEMHELGLLDFQELMEVYEDIGPQVLVTADRRLDRSSRQLAARQAEQKDASNATECDSVAAAVPSDASQSDPKKPPSAALLGMAGVVGSLRGANKFKANLIGSPKTASRKRRSSVSNVFNAVQKQTREITRTANKRISKPTNLVSWRTIDY
jgi:hypothetical protein